MSNEAVSLLHLLAAHPTLLDPAPVGSHTMHRVADAHLCLRCGGRAHQAFVAHTEIGPRLLDLCMACSSWLRKESARLAEREALGKPGPAG